MAATVKAGTAKSRPPRPEIPAADNGYDDALIRLDEEPEAEPERVPVFAIGDTVYTMLANPPASLALRAMELAERRGATEVSVGLADVQIMRDMLGEEAYRALLDSKTLTRKQYTVITQKVMKAAMGSLEDDGRPNR